MKTSTFRLQVLPVFKKLATRAQGVKAREHVVKLLELHTRIELDFDRAMATPSFIDELVGGLSDELGDIEFHEKVKLRNIHQAMDPLVRHVLLHHRARRSAECA